MALSDVQADQIANLLNTRNALTVDYDRDRIKKEAEDYLLRCSDSGEVVAVVQVKKVQWYQFEVLHLTVAEAHTGLGHAKALLCEAERRARAASARLLQCTIREGNAESHGLFVGFGFVRVASFCNERSGNNVGVYQKVLVPAR